MKIYFAASVRGGRGDVDIYGEIIKLLKPYGEVLTLHLGDKNLTNQGETKIPDTEVYERDIAWLTSADVVIAEVTNPSLGVGYELGFAEKFNKKILCLYRQTPNKRLSNMISGNKNLIVRYYGDISEVPEILKEFFK